MTRRKVWFITRPERDPRFHADAIKALAEATNNFTEKWQGNRDLHKKYEEVLASKGLKRNNISNDGSGGRTWAAMLKTFAYCYPDHNGYLKPTKVGQALIDGIKEYTNVKKQILTLQIPNAYFLEPGFRPKFEDGFHIRPARFLIKLVQRKDLDYYLTKEEITYFALTAKNDNQLDEVAKKILSFRQSDGNNKDQIKQDIAIEYDHRDRNDHAARDYFQAHSDVAHTFMMLCEYTDLVIYERVDAILKAEPSLVKDALKVLNYYDERYPFNSRYLISLERMAQNNGLDVDSYKASSYGDIKPANNRGKKQVKIDSILNSIPNAHELSEEELLPHFESTFSPREAKEIVSEIKNNVQELSSIPEAFVEKYLGDLDPTEFEIETLKIFEAIGFEAVYKPNVDGTLTEIEILLKYKNQCGIIDTKHYPNGFALSQNLANYMASEYIRNYIEYEGKQLTFYGYVTSGKFTGDKKLQSIKELSAKLVGREIEGIMLTREVLLGFLDYCLENNLSKEERINLFISKINTSSYNTLHKLLDN